MNVIVVGGGIGGLAAALALARIGVAVEVFEQSERIGEIGAGIQLGPNAFAALDALGGVGEAARKRAVFTEKLILMDAVDASEVAVVEVGAAFRTRFGNPYAVIHRADIHLSILGRSFMQRLVTQFYFPGDPLLEYDPMYMGVPDERARKSLVAQFDWEHTIPEHAIAYRFDIVLRGRDATPMERPR